MTLTLESMTTIISLALLGLVLLLAEMFLPGLILGLVGLALMAVAIVLGYVQFGPATGTVIFAALGGISLILFLVWMRYFQKTRVGQGLTLARSLSSGNELPGSRNLIGKTGFSSTDLRPTGRAMIDQVRVEVMAESGFIEAGTAITVIAADSNRILVRKNS